LLIRIAEIADLSAMVDIYNQAISQGQRTADTELFSVESRLGWFDAHPSKKYPLLVAVDVNSGSHNNEKIIGYLTISPYREGRKAFLATAEVSYYVHFDHHRKGVASQLINHALGLCPSLNIKTLIAMLLGSNEASISFLEKYGFSEWGRMPVIAEFDQHSVDHLYYGKHI